MQWVMIAVTYTRQPKTTVHKGSISVTECSTRKVPKNSLNEKELASQSFQAATMDQVIKILHGYLQTYPDAQVTLIRPQAAGYLKQTAQNNPKAFELDEKMRNTIRDNLPAALEMFAPYEITVRVRPATPTLHKQEN